MCQPASFSLLEGVLRSRARHAGDPGLAYLFRDVGSDDLSPQVRKAHKIYGTMKSVVQSFISYLLCDWVASLGAIITTTSAVVFLTFAFQGFSNPYYGIIVFLIFPAFFVLGLILIPVGVWRCSKRSGGIWNIPQIQLTGPAAPVRSVFFL